MVVVDSPEIAVQMIELGSLTVGWFSRGLMLAIASEILFRPIARKIKKKAKAWEKTHPWRIQWALHFLENHKGLRPSKCQKGQCEADIAF